MSGISVAPATILLIHGMGRTPASMLLLAHRLRRQGNVVRLFGYSATFHKLDHCIARLKKVIESVDGPFVIVGHSLGTVLTRLALDGAARQPRCCFFLAPPTVACTLARKLGPQLLFRLATGEMGQLLGDSTFMTTLPVPKVPVHVFVGTGGPRGKLSPFGDAPNDGVLAVDEATLPGHAFTALPVLHTFIMNAPEVALAIGHAA